MRPLLAVLLLALACPASAREVDEDEAGTTSGLLRMGGFNVFTVSDAPLGFIGAAAGEAPKGAIQLGEVSGRACQRGLSIPISLDKRQSVSAAGGKGGFKRVWEEIKKKSPDAEGLTDVRVDVRQTSILFGIFQRSCLEVVGRAWKR